MIYNEKIRFTLRITAKLHKKLKQEAQNRGLTMNILILEILWQYLKGQALNENLETEVSK